MSVLDRSELEASPLADLHLLANQLGIDGFRRLRKADLIDAIIARQNGEAPVAEEAPSDEERPARTRSSRRRGGRGRVRDADEDAEEATEAAEQAAAAADDQGDDDAAGRRRRRRGGRREDAEPAEERSVDGVVELQPNGSGFVRVSHPEPSDDDVYISAAQVKRCELVSGDRISGPVRTPRRSERFASLVRIDTINGKPADEVAEGTKFDDLPATFATERLELGGDDATVNAVEWLTPFGKGSRVVVCGGSRAGKTELLRRIAGLLAGRDGLEVAVALAGVRPEEVGEWNVVAPAAVATFAASAEAQAQTIEQVVEQGRRVAARGGDAVVIVDALSYLAPQTARRLLAAARNIADGGSLTIIAAAAEPVGGETTVVALDAQLASQRRFPALDLLAGGTLRPELLVGEAGAEEIARKRAEFAAEITR